MAEKLRPNEQMAGVLKWRDTREYVTLPAAERNLGGGYQRLRVIDPRPPPRSPQMNPVYHAQLKEVFQLPQSAGIVGGRPGSSLFFVGYQDEYVVYLDPHFARPAPRTGADLGTYHCDTVRHMAIGAMDPSLAIGFYCATAGAYATARTPSPPRLPCTSIAPSLLSAM